MKMKILITIQHPAHVHFFRNAVKRLISDGHDVKIVVVDREITSYLLDTYGLEYDVYEKLYDSMVGKGYGQLKRHRRLYDISRKFRPDIITATGELAVSHVAKIFGADSIVWPDTEPAKIIHTVSFPFASAIMTPDCFSSRVPTGRYIQYPGYHELAYLHPNRFDPDPSVLDKIDVSSDERIILVRFSSWDSSHDIGQKTFKDMEERMDLVSRLEEHGKVLVTSEIDLPSEMRDKGLKISPEDIHDLLYYTDLYVGEGATLASEAGVLGVPWIWISGKERRGYLDDQERRYGLGFSIDTPRGALEKAQDLLKTPTLKETWRKKRKRLLKEKIDVTSFMVWFYEKWPESFELCKKGKNPYF